MRLAFLRTSPLHCYEPHPALCFTIAWPSWMMWHPCLVTHGGGMCHGRCGLRLMAHATCDACQATLVSANACWLTRSWLSCHRLSLLRATIFQESQRRGRSAAQRIVGQRCYNTNPYLRVMTRLVHWYSAVVFAVSLLPAAAFLTDTMHERPLLSSWRHATKFSRGRIPLIALAY